MTFSDLVVSLRLETAKFTAAMNNVRRNVARFSSSLAAASRTGGASELIEGYTSLNDRLHKVGLGFKDIARIAAGITISQSFYTITRSIRDATDAMWSFNESLDYAQITYGSLFGDADLATDFIDTLKQFSVDTIFEYTDIEGMARKLSAYGIEYQNLMYIIEGLTSLGTISGDSAALERLAVAIGQINAKGTLKAEEMRQLANAYVPIYDVLREKLHLTEEDLKSVGDLGIKSADAINAIIEYANENFGSTAEAAIHTITGLNNRIVDTLKVMGASIISPITTLYKSVAKYTADGLANLHEIYKKSGLGGVFEYLVPSEEWQFRLRSLIAAFKNFVSTIAVNVAAAWPYVKQFLGGVIDAFTIFLSAINTVGTGLAGLVHTISSNTGALRVLTAALVTAASAWMLFRIQALGAFVISALKVVIVDLAKAIVFLSAAIVKNPIVSGLLLLGAVLIGVATNAKNTNSAISNLVNSLNSYSAGGDVADDILQVEDAMGGATDNSDKFWESMKGGAEDTEDAIDGAGKAAKNASRNLLSFDEVFRLNEDTGSGSGVGSGMLDGIGDLADTLSGLGSALIPEIPDLGDYANRFVNSLYNSLWEAVKVIASGGATGALIGGLVGFAIGGLITKTMKGTLTGAKYGASIGSIAGAAFAGFWTDTYKEMEASLTKIATGTSAGLLIGGLLGMVIGAFATSTVDGALTGAKYGASIGSLLGAGIGAFWAGATEEMSNAIEGIVVGSGAGLLVGGLTGLLIGAFSTRTLAGALAGAKYGAKLGTLIGGAFGGIFGAASEELKKQIERMVVGGAEGALVGGLAGLMLGAFATGNLAGAITGAKFGSAIGSMLGVAFSGIFGDAESSLSENVSNMFSSVEATSYAMLAGGLVGMIVGAVIGAFAGGVGAIPGAKLGATLGAAAGGLGMVLAQKLEELGVPGLIAEWFTKIGQTLIGAATAVKEWFIDEGNWKSIALLIVWPVAGAVQLLYDYNVEFKAWVDELREIVTSGFEELKNWFVDEGNWKGVTTLIVWPVVGAAQLLYNNNSEFKKWVDDLYSKVKLGFDKTAEKISTWATNTAGNISTWVINTAGSISTWVTNTTSTIGTWVTNTTSTIGTWVTNTAGNISTWATDTVRDISSWSTETANKLSTWYTTTAQSMSSWVTETKQSLRNWWSNLWDPSTWKSGWSSIKSWFSDLFESIRGWFSGIGTSISSWWNGLWDDKSVSVKADNKTTGGGSFKLGGHATGGIFNREHIARFAEGNKAEAVIPLENQSAMQPFVNAISDGILQGILPTLSVNGGSNNLPPMYVGTLIGDERGLQQLFKKFEVYEAKELARKGMA